MAALLGRVMGSVWFGVQPLDAATFWVVTPLVAITVAVSIAGPAWRATRIDPAVALRSK